MYTEELRTTIGNLFKTMKQACYLDPTHRDFTVRLQEYEFLIRLQLFWEGYNVVAMSG